jgi:hypothetical protein
MSTRPTKREATPVQFEVNEAYEKMISQRERDPNNYQLQHSLAEKRAAEHYLIAKRKAEAKP